MNMPLVLLNRRRRGGPAAFSPTRLFALAEPGVWYDPSDLTTLFTDTAGTTPVTTPGQTVALALDKSKGLVLGPELVVNGGFATDTDWTKGTGWAIVGGAAVATAVASGVSISQAIGSMVAGRSYRLTLEISSISGGIRPYAGTGGSFGTTISATGTYSWTLLAAGTGGIYIATAGTTTATIDNISVKELPGFHATQATAASRPTYGIVPATGRRNLLTRTEEFNDAAWVKAPTSSISANSTLDPNGTLTADTYSQTSGSPYLTQGITISAAGPVTASIRLKKSVGDHIRIFVTDTATLANGFGCWVNISNPASPSIGTTRAIGTEGTFTSATVSDLGGGWCVVRLSGQAGSATSISLGMFVANADNSGTRLTPGSVILWGAQLETGSSATAYQRVGSAFDVTEAGVASLSYLSFDGIDDHLVTPTVSFSTDKMTVFAGVRKLSDAAAGLIVESSTTLSTNAGSFGVFAPISAAANYGFHSRGSLFGSSASSASSFAAPITSVITGLGDISGDIATLRVNGTQAAQSTADQGTGNFLAYQLYIGRRAGTSLPLNGQLFSLIVRNAATDAATITSSETWVAGKTGVTL